MKCEENNYTVGRYLQINIRSLSLWSEAVLEVEWRRRSETLNRLTVFGQLSLIKPRSYIATRSRHSDILYNGSDRNHNQRQSEITKLNNSSSIRRSKSYRARLTSRHESREVNLGFCWSTRQWKIWKDLKGTFLEECPCVKTTSERCRCFDGSKNPWNLDAESQVDVPWGKFQLL